MLEKENQTTSREYVEIYIECVSHSDFSGKVVE